MDVLMEILKRIKMDVDFENEIDLVDRGVLDSLEIVEIITEIEEKFEIEIEATYIDPDNFQSVDAMWRMITEIKQKMSR